jgi:hypothetical protein
MAGTTRTNIRPNDYYGTPAWCVEKLIPLIDWSMINSFHEPCIGMGNIFELIPVKNKSWHEILLDKDYLIDQDLPQVDLVLTNPPFKYATEFIEQALSHAKTVIMLCKLDLMGSVDRSLFWEKHPPTNIIVMNERPSFTANGKSDGCVYAWYVWGDNSVLKNASPFQWISKKSQL